MAVKPDNHALTKDSFKPHPWLKNAHLMTIVPIFMARGLELKEQAMETQIIKVSEESAVLAHCHFLPDRKTRPTVLLVHGLEGSSDSFYILGLAEKAIALGMNVIRLNLRSCGDSLHLTPTLYNAGLSEDVLKVIDWLVEQQGLSDLFIVGVSLGGNTVLKAAAELGQRSQSVSGVCAISPSIGLDACVHAMEQGLGRVYQWHFLNSLKGKLMRKAKLFPGRFDLKKLRFAKSIRLFDDIYTAPDGGYADVQDYYKRASALPFLKEIKVPTLILTAQDDPIVPFRLFLSVETEFVSLVAPQYGGHAAFIGVIKDSGEVGKIDRFWSDEQVLSFCLANSRSANSRVGQDAGPPGINRQSKGG